MLSGATRPGLVSANNASAWHVILKLAKQGFRYNQGSCNI